MKHDRNVGINITVKKDNSMSTLITSLLAFVVGLAVGLFIWMKSKSNATDLEKQVAVLEAEQTADKEKQAWLENAEEKLKDSFGALAGEVLKSNSEAFANATRKDVKSVIDPLTTNLTNLDKYVRELEANRQGAYKSIETELSNIKEVNAMLQGSTNSLSEALRSPTVRGRWGEMELRRVVEMSGMEKHISFEEQVSGEKGIPDMVVHLPNGGELPVDAKFVMNQFIDAIESSDEKERKQLMQNHVTAMKTQINSLGLKKYFDQFDSAPPFVIMFVPNEACVSSAYERDKTLLEYALDKKVLLCSPVTLLALLRSVAFGWQQHEVTKNAVKITKEGKELYSRLGVFAQHFIDMGASLEKSVGKYNEAVGSFDTRLVPSITRFKELGVSDNEIGIPCEIDRIPSEIKKKGQLEIPEVIEEAEK
jgi:DNA recombination protein RmuC